MAGAGRAVVPEAGVSAVGAIAAGTATKPLPFHRPAPATYRQVARPGSITERGTRIVI